MTNPLIKKEEKVGGSIADNRCSLCEADNCLHGRVALVTGGAQGIGRAIVEHFQQAGALVCILDCDIGPAEKLAALLTSKFPDRPVSFLQANLERVEDILAVADHFRAKYAQLDVLVNNAGIEIDQPFEQTTLSNWEQIQAVNLRAPFLLTQKLLPLFPLRGGAIINISSIHSTHAFANAIPYACSKAGLIALTRNLALELAPRNIRVNALCPGYVDTRLWEQYLQHAPNADDLAAQTTALHPLGRRGFPQDIAPAALFLASKASSFMTGTQIVLDGGLTIRAHM